MRSARATLTTRLGRFRIISRLVRREANDSASAKKREVMIRHRWGGLALISIAAFISGFLLRGVLFAEPAPATATAASATASSRLDTVLRRGKLIVGTYSSSPPVAFVDRRGELVGFEIEMARAIAKDLFGDPNKVEFVVLSSNGRFPAVLAGKVDFAMCSTTVTGDRAARMAFTVPYLDTGGTVIARRDAGLTKVSQLNDPRHTYAIINNPGSIERAATVLPQARTLIFETPSAMLLATKAGRATAFNMDKAIADRYIADNPDLMLLDTRGTAYETLAGNAIYLQPGDFKWWLFLDTWVRELRGGSRYAEYQRLYRKWLGKEPPPQRFYDVRQY
jgi:polar amino acid transport system substrate-binding protein